MIRALAIAASVCVAASAALAQEREALVIVSDDARHELAVEMAVTPDEKRTGLMFRREMADDHGMLFVYDGEAVRTMWMRNTILPLDMIFIGEDGEIVSIHEDAIPFDETTISSRVPAMAVLEVNAGIADALDIAVGDSVEHPSFDN